MSITSDVDCLSSIRAENIGVKELREDGKKNRVVVNFLKKFLPMNEMDRVRGIKNMIRKVIRRAKSVGVWRRFNKLDKSFLTLVVMLQIKLKGFVLIKTLLDVLKRLMFLLSPMYRYYVMDERITERNGCKESYMIYSSLFRDNFYRYDDRCEIC